MTDPLRMGVVGIDHRHIYTMVANMQGAGAELAGWWTDGTPTNLEGFLKRFPDTPRAASAETLFEDKGIDVILTSAVPADRARIALTAMDHGKDVMTDKPGCLTMADLTALKDKVAKTGRIWSVDFSERFEVPAVTLASRLVSEGAIGSLVQTLGLGPHRLNAATRPDWFFDRAQNGGILADVGSHQIDQFLHFAGAGDAEITLASVACHRESGFQDFGQLALKTGNVTGYIRVDWFTPDALPTWGDGRLFLLGTEGTIELRKYLDVGGAPGTDHVLLTNGSRCERIDASGTGLPYFAALVADIGNRTETAMAQAHAFKVTELAIRAQEMAEAEC
ncbi:MAG: Gfo/Idh/MocA family oxidoreductase [Pseudomonadota bacterium]